MAQKDGQLRRFVGKEIHVLERMCNVGTVGTSSTKLKRMMR